MPSEETSKLRQLVAGIGLMTLALILVMAYVSALFGVFWLLSAAVQLVFGKEVANGSPVRLLAFFAGMAAAYKLKAWAEQDTQLGLLRSAINRYGGWDSSRHDF
jgi:hypothetical protein